MNADQRTTARAERDEIRKALQGPLITTAGEGWLSTRIAVLLNQADAIDGALSSVEQERDALKAALGRVAALADEWERYEGSNNGDDLSVGLYYGTRASAALVRSALHSVSVEEGTDHE